MSLSPFHALAKLPPAAQAAWLAEQPDWVIEDIARREWWWIARPEQRQPPGDWFVWLILSGRGWGKTQTGGEWIVDRTLTHPVDSVGRPTERLLIAETLSDATRLCMEGPAGVRRVLERRVGPERRSQHDKSGVWRFWKSPKPFIEIFDAGDVEHFPHRRGQLIYIEGADDEDVGRGYNAADAWLDEFAKWPKPDGSWAEGIMPSLRADVPGDHPRCLVTTTPKAVVQLIEWRKRNDGSVHLTTGSTYENAANLAPKVIAELHRRYHGTRLGRQELGGELIEELEGALWSMAMIDPYRVTDVPALTRIAVAMDPAGTGARDYTGLVAVGRGEDGDGYVLGDWSKQVAGHPACRRAWEMFSAYDADVLVVEKNQGQAYLIDMLSQAFKEMRTVGEIVTPYSTPPIKIVNAKKGKRIRAEPVAARYEQGRYHHAAKMPDLETQQISWEPDQSKDSPDRVDALVYAGLYLDGRDPETGGEIANPGTRSLASVGLGGSPMGPLAGRGPYG